MRDVVRSNANAALSTLSIRIVSFYPFVRFPICVCLSVCVRKHHLLLSLFVTHPQDIFVSGINACFLIDLPMFGVAGANQKSSSHFHCLKCDYYCTDTNKVRMHKRAVHIH